MAKHNGLPLWQPQHHGMNYSAENLRYRYHLHPTKSSGTAFRTHFQIVSKIYPVFTTDEWTKLSSGSSRDVRQERWLATKDRAEFYVHSVGSSDPAYRHATKKSIVLVTAQPDGTWLLSVPCAGDPCDDTEADSDGGRGRRVRSIKDVWFCQ